MIKKDQTGRAEEEAGFGFGFGRKMEEKKEKKEGGKVLSHAGRTETKR